MSFEDFRRGVKTEVFDYQLIASYFKDLKKIRDKVSDLIADGKIVRLKRGLYVFGEKWRLSPLNLEVVANVLYGPSCISFEYALARYGLIAERPKIITSLAIGDSKNYITPIGQFEYRAIEAKKFMIGIEYVSIENDSGYFIASREKALVDFVYCTKGIRTLDQLRYYLFEEMRMDEALFRSLDFNKLNEIADVYEKNSVYMIGKI